MTLNQGSFANSVTNSWDKMERDFEERTETCNGLLEEKLSLMSSVHSELVSGQYCNNRVECFKAKLTVL